MVEKAPIYRLSRSKAPKTQQICHYKLTRKTGELLLLFNTSVNFSLRNNFANSGSFAKVSVPVHNYNSFYCKSRLLFGLQVAEAEDESIEKHEVVDIPGDASIKPESDDFKSSESHSDYVSIHQSQSKEEQLSFEKTPDTVTEPTNTSSMLLIPEKLHDGNAQAHGNLLYKLAPLLTT